VQVHRTTKSEELSKFCHKHCPKLEIISKLKVKEKLQVSA